MKLRMTVADVIEALSKLDKDLHCFHADSEYGSFFVSKVEVCETYIEVLKPGLECGSKRGDYTLEKITGVLIDS